MESVTQATLKNKINLIKVTSLYKNVFKVVVHNDLTLFCIPTHKAIKSETV